MHRKKIVSLCSWILIPLYPPPFNAVQAILDMSIIHKFSDICSIFPRDRKCFDRQIDRQIECINIFQL